MATSEAIIEEARSAPNMPPRNAWLTNSVYPTSHANPAATDAVPWRGPTKGKRLMRERDVKVVANLMVSNPTVKKVGADTVIFASGAFGIRKIFATGTSFDSLSFLPYPGLEQQAALADAKRVQTLLAQMDAARRTREDDTMLDAIAGFDRVGLDVASRMNGVYNMIDRDGYHYCVYGGTCVLKSSDDNIARGDVRIVKTVDVAALLPPDVAKGVSHIVGLNMTYDGYLAVAASGALLVLDRELNLVSYVAFAGEEVHNGIAIDDRNSLYVVSSRRMLKVVWDGERLSTNAEDGAWESPYESSRDDEGGNSRGSGTTPTLMGFGDDPDRLVVIADAAESGTNLVAFWRDDIPDDFEQKPGTKSRRIADQARIEISRNTIEASPNVFGYGVLVLNSTYPKPVESEGLPNMFTAGVTRAAPFGIEKFQWNTRTRRLVKSWINEEIDNSDMMVPVVSSATGLVYAAHKEDGIYQYVGLDWATGALRQRWIFPDESCLWNAAGGVTTVLENGDLLIGGVFGIKRVSAGDTRRASDATT